LAAIVIVALLALGAALGSGFLKINLDTSEDTSYSKIAGWTSYSKGLVDQPSEFKVDQYRVDPYKGPYHYLWMFGDGISQEGSMVAVHNYTIPGVFYVQVQVTGSDDWSDLLDIGSITILGPGSLNITVIDNGNCQWNETHLSDRYLNFTIWNDEVFPIDLCKYSFGLVNATGGNIRSVDEQSDMFVTLQGGDNLTWTIFFAPGEDVPVKLKYFDLFQWDVEWKD